MASAYFHEYNRNLKRIYLAEFVEDQLQDRESWRRRASPTGRLMSESVRAEVRSRLKFRASK